MSARAPRRSAKLTRRRFVALAGAGLAAVTAGVAAAAPATDPPKSGAAKPKKSAATPAAAPTAHQKEFERQKAGTLAALKTIRAYALPPGGDLPVVFKPLRTPKKER